MTMPVGSGKNACYGYQNDDDSLAEQDPAVSTPPDDGSLTCSGEEHSSSSVKPAAEKPPRGSGACDLEPDYITLTGSVSLFLGATVSVTRDRYDHVYTAGGGNASTPGLGGSLMAGYLRDPDDFCQPPTDEQLSQFLSGSAVTYSGGSGIAVGVSESSGMTAREIGLSTPQLGVASTLSARHPGWE